MPSDPTKQPIHRPGLGTTPSTALRRAPGRRRRGARPALRVTFLMPHKRNRCRMSICRAGQTTIELTACVTRRGPNVLRGAGAHTKCVS